MTMIRGVRGATTAEEDTAEAIWEATHEMLQAMIDRNGIEEDTVASIIFTTTQDLTAEFPAKVARESLGWHYTPLLGCQEQNVRMSTTQYVIRVIIHWNTNKGLREIEHVYLRGAKALRPDLSNNQGEV